MSEHDPAGKAREEAAAQVVAIIGGLVFILAASVVQRKASDPDAARTARMRLARAGERFCARTAGNWWRLAERFRLAYEREAA